MMMRTAAKGKFDRMSFIRSVAIIAIPVALQNLLTTTGSMVDTMMIGKLGELNVAAVGLCAQFSSLMFSCYWGFVGGGMLFFSQFWGSRDDEGIEWSYGMTFVCMMTVGLIFGILGIFFPQTVMALYTDKTAIRTIGVEYLKIAAFSYPIQVYSMVMCSVLRSTERMQIPMYSSLASVATNIFLNWVFIYGHLGAPAMGVRGAALATVCAAIVNAACSLILAKAVGSPYIFRIRRHFRWNRERITEYLRKCFPIICNELLIGIGNMVINIVLGRQVEEAIAAAAVFRTLEGMVIGFFAGFSNAASILVGANVGAGEHEKAYERAWRLVYLCQGTIAAVGLLLVSLRAPILHAMSLDGDAFRYGSGMLIIYCTAAIIRMGNWVQNDTYRSAGDAVTGTVLEIVFMYAMLLPCVCISGLVIKAPVLITFAFCYVDEPIRYVIMQRHMYSAKWIRPVTAAGKATLPDFLKAHGKAARPAA